MSLTQREVEALLPKFEGLVKETARLIVSDGVEMDYDDVCQALRVKVWQAVLKFSEERAAASQHLSHAKDKRGRTPLERFVYGAVRNLRFDLERRHVRRYNKSIDEIRERRGDSEDGKADEWFDGRFLSVDADEVYREVFEPMEPDLPPDLTEVERQVVLLTYRGELCRDIDRALGLSRAQRQRVLESAREKLARRPGEQPRHAPTPPLPVAVRQLPAARAPLAA